METKIVKRKRLNIARTLVFILFIYIIVCLGIYIYKEPIRHIEISGNSLVSDADIIRLADLIDYPPYISVSPSKVATKIEMNPLIADAQVKFSWDFTIKIEITENDPLFIVKSDNTICLADGERIENDGSIVGIPMLLNDTPDSIMTEFSKSLAAVDKGILYLISEIEYAPSYNDQNQPIDEYRFLLTMTDNNMIYITVSKIELLNKYLDIVSSSQVTGTGTLYLDSDSEGYVFQTNDKNTNEDEKNDKN